MPRDGSGIYTLPFPNVVPATSIESAFYNGFTNDVKNEFNSARPIIAGGSGSSTVDGALDNLSAEKFKQVVTNWDSTTWRAGSFYAATSATGAAPIPGRAFAGIVYYANATDFVVEATDLTAGAANVKYVRKQTAGVWESWSAVDLTRKNYVINGAMMVSQENGATAVGTGNYPVDQFTTAQAVTTAVYNLQQIASLSPAGSPNRLRLTVTTADAAVAAGDVVHLYTRLEGLRVADLAFGTANARTVTIQFGVRAPAGTYGVSLFNAALSRCCVATYTVTAGESGTDVVKSVTIPGDTSGTWLRDANTGIEIRWALMAGTTYQGTAGVWGASGAVSTSGQFNLMAGGTFELFDVSLTEGNSAPPFIVPDYASELIACMRYYEKSPGNRNLVWIGSCVSGSVYGVTAPFKALKRGAPTVTIVGNLNSLFPVPTAAVPSSDYAYAEATASGTGYGYFMCGYTANARL